MLNTDFDTTIREFLLSANNGRVTEEIAAKYGMSNRQVGGRTANLKKKGLIYSYTKGVVILSAGPCSPSAPMGLSNSLYQWCGD